MENKPTLAEAQHTIRQVALQLRHADDQLAALSSALPEPTSVSFDAQAELRNAVECVRVELLADALDTLAKAAAGGPLSLRMNFELRRQLLVQQGAE